MDRSLIQYVINRLSLLSDDELKGLDYDSGLAAIGKDVLPTERQQLVRLFSQIRKELPIQHHGIKGMKWGVRRYQNADGTLTALGRRRAADESAKSSVFGTAKQFQVNTRNGDMISVKPVKPWSVGKKVINALFGISEKDDMGRRGDANYDLIDSSGKSIGQLSLISKNSDTAYIDWITIDKEQRGKGYATDIINDLLAKAKDSGYSKVELNALKQPRPLYERLGFTYSDKSKVGIIERISEFEFGCKHMEYDLDKLHHADVSDYLVHSGIPDVRITMGKKFVDRFLNYTIKE